MASDPSTHTNERKISEIKRLLSGVEQNLNFAKIWFTRLDFATLDPKIREELLKDFAKIMHLTTETYGSIQEPVSMNRELSEKTKEAMILLEKFMLLYNKINKYAGHQVEDRAKRRYIVSIFTILQQSLLDMDHTNPMHISIDTSGLDNTNSIERKIKKVLDKAVKTFNLASDNYKQIKEASNKNKISRMIERMKNIISPPIPDYDPTQNTLLTFSDENPVVEFEVDALGRRVTDKTTTKKRLSDSELAASIRLKGMNVDEELKAKEQYLQESIADDIADEAAGVRHVGMFKIMPKPEPAFTSVPSTLHVASRSKPSAFTSVPSTLHVASRTAFTSERLSSTPVVETLKPSAFTSVPTTLPVASRLKPSAFTSSRVAPVASQSEITKTPQVVDYFRLYETKQQTSEHVPSAPSTISNPVHVPSAPSTISNPVHVPSAPSTISNPVHVPDYFSMYVISPSTKK